jgi:hypothetical protein
VVSAIDDYKRLARELADFGQVMDAQQSKLTVHSIVHIGRPGSEILDTVITGEAFRELVAAECSNRLELAKSRARAEAEFFLEGKDAVKP